MPLIRNISVLLVPALALGFDETEGLSVIEVLGYLIALGGYLFVIIADS